LAAEVEQLALLVALAVAAATNLVLEAQEPTLLVQELLGKVIAVDTFLEQELMLVQVVVVVLALPV
jgi:hypothetical protein